MQARDNLVARWFVLAIIRPKHITSVILYGKNGVQDIVLSSVLKTKYKWRSTLAIKSVSNFRCLNWQLKTKMKRA